MTFIQASIRQALFQTLLPAILYDDSMCPLASLLLLQPQLANLYCMRRTCHKYMPIGVKLCQICDAAFVHQYFDLTVPFCR